MKWCLAVLLLVVGSCRTVGPAEDFPQIPLPPQTVMEPVRATRTEDGYLLAEAEYEKALRMIQGLVAEVETLRKIITSYNDWAASRRGK